MRFKALWHLDDADRNRPRSPMTAMWPLAALFVSLALISGGSAAPGPPEPTATTPSSDLRPVDLTKPFGTRSLWRFVAIEGPTIEDYNGDPAPGLLQLCLEKGAPGTCVSEPLSLKLEDSNPPGYWGPHFLDMAKPVYPQGRTAPPLFLVKTSSPPSLDGGRILVTQLLRYDRTRDEFERVYFHRSGSNHNEAVRFVADGPLKGSVISADPTETAPFGYWIVVGRFTPARSYRQVLRYRSATRYNDGNPLAVIDSETPNIERRLGLWKAGAPLPPPAGKPCAKPSLKRMELWCE
jgi:hypothetical protein